MIRALEVLAGLWLLGCSAVSYVADRVVERVVVLPGWVSWCLGREGRDVIALTGCVVIGVLQLPLLT